MDAHWGQWISWGACTAECTTEGGSVPTQSRQRHCIDGKFGGKSCTTLGKEAVVNNLPTIQGTRNCINLPNCPIIARLRKWSKWSQCTETCHKETKSQPQRMRMRECEPEIPSTNEALNKNLITCATLGEQREYAFCDIPICPGKKRRKGKLEELLFIVFFLFSVEAEWQSWGDWGACSPSCGPGATQKRTRSYFSGRYGFKGEPKKPHSPEPRNEESRDCTKSPPCPEPTRFSDWGDWSPCPQGCYREGSLPPVTQRKKTCIEGQGEGVTPCNLLADITESKSCNTAICKGGKCNLFIMIYIIYHCANVSDQSSTFTHKTKMSISISWKCFLAFNVLNMTTGG